jgi:Tfp pilus assembly protein PilX
MRFRVQMPNNSLVSADVSSGPAVERPTRGVVALTKSERGFALVYVLLCMVMLTIMTTSVVQYTVSNSHTAGESNQRNLAFAQAESGLNAAVSWLYNNQSQWHSTSPITTGPIGSNGLTYTYTLTPNFPIWTIKSTGTSTATQGALATTHTVSENLKVGESSAGINITLWNMYFSDAPAGTPSQCMHWNAIIESPIYVRGDICVDANGDSDAIVGWPPVSLPGAAQIQIGGHVYLNGGHFGWSGANPKINKIQTGIGCAQWNSGTPGASHNPCSSADNLWAQQYLTGTPNLTKPTIDLATWYKDSLPGPKNNCTSGTFPGGFDTDGTQNNSLGTVNLTPVSAYDCKFTDGTGATVGEVKWTPGAPGTLLINGTVFWDGNLVVSSSFNYTGRATFYFAGTITLNSGVSICGYAACGTSWNTDTNMLVLVAGSANQSPSWAINAAATSKMQGAMEAVGDITQNSGATMWGCLLAHQLYNLSANDNWKPFNTGTAGQPATGSYQEGLSVVPSSFSG